MEERNVAVVEAHTAFFDVRGGEEVAAGFFVAVVAEMIAAVVADCVRCLYSVVATVNRKDVH